MGTILAALANQFQALLARARDGDTDAIGWLALGVAALVWLMTRAAQALATLLSPAKPAEGLELAYPPLYTEGFPVVGNVAAFARNPLQLAKRAYAQLGDVFTLRVGPKRFTFLVGPRAHEVFFRANDDELDQGPVYGFSVPVFGRGVVYDAPLAIRLEQFRFVSTALRAARLREYVPLMVAEAETYFKRHWHGTDGTADLLKSLSELIILTASRCLMGREVREQLFEEVSTLYHQLDQGMQPLSVFAPHFPCKAHWQRDRARREMRRLFASIIANRRKRYQEIAAQAESVGQDPQQALEAAKEVDVLQVFMDSQYRDGSRLTDDEITGLLIAVLFAGQHTSTITGTWTGLLMLRKPELVTRVRAEQEQVLYDDDGCFKIDYDALLRLDVMHRCIKEALRMYPPLIFLMREVVIPRTYRDYVIPKGDIVVVSPPLAMRLPEVFADPDRYDPDRYAPPREEDKRVPFSHIGFGGGRHACMGEQFAYLQIKTIWSVILRDYDLEPVGPLPLPDYSAMVVGPKPPCLVRWRRRTP
jgi:sterol 14-demethylase